MKRLLSLLFLLMPFSLFAQTGAVTGVALDSLGNTVAGATITVCPQGSSGVPCSPVTASTTSNGQGAFSVTVPVGTYTVTVFRTGIISTSSTVVVAPSNITVANNVTYNGTVNFTGNNTHSGTETFTGLLQCKNFENVRCVDTSNSQGWSGSDPGQWINSAMAAAAGGGTGGIVWVMPGNYATTATTITLTGPSTLLLQGADLFSTASPVVSTSGNGNSVFGLSRNISTIVNNGTGITIAMAANSSFNTFRDFLITSSSTGDAFQFNDNDRATSVENVQMQMGGHGGHCAQQVAGTQGTEFNRFTQVWCTASASPAFNFDTSGGTNAGNWEYFEDVFAVSVTGGGVGFLVANGSATFVRTSTDSSTTGYQFGASVNGVARITMENTDDEADTTGISIVGPGDYTIKHHNCGTISGTCIAVASAGANTTIIDPASQATSGTNDITYSAASTGRHILISGAGLSKPVVATAPAFYTAVGADVIANGGRLGAGGVATGSIAGDVTCARGATSAACYWGLDGNMYLLRTNANSAALQLPGTWVPTTDASFDMGQTAQRWRNLLISGTIQNGTATMGLTLKKGSGGGNYTNATTSYTVADSTNLCFTVTIPTGWKLGISASGALSTATAAVVAQAALTDNAACSTANAGILVETAPIQGAAIGVADAFALEWVVTGDGASHNIALQFKTSNAADTASLINSSATIIPTMKFQLTPSN